MGGLPARARRNLRWRATLLVFAGIAGAAWGQSTSRGLADFHGDPAAIRRMEAAWVALNAARQQLGAVRAKFHYSRELLVGEQVVPESFRGELLWSRGAMLYTAYRADTGALQAGVFRGGDRWVEARPFANSAQTLFVIQGNPTTHPQFFAKEESWLTPLDPAEFFGGAFGHVEELTARKDSVEFPADQDRDAVTIRGARNEITYRFGSDCDGLPVRSTGSILERGKMEVGAESRLRWARVDGKWFPMEIATDRYTYIKRVKLQKLQHSLVFDEVNVNATIALAELRPEALPLKPGSTGMDLRSNPSIDLMFDGQRFMTFEEAEARGAKIAAPSADEALPPPPPLRNRHRRLYWTLAGVCAAAAALAAGYAWRRRAGAGT